MVIALCAGEASGDQLAAQFASGLVKRYPQAQLFGVGGTAMAEAGIEIIADYRPLAVMGYWDALRSLPGILRVRRTLLAQIQARKPTLFIGVDAPDFNLPIARRVRSMGMRTVQWVAPSVWMWRRERLTTIRRAVDQVWCLLPFEQSVYEEAGIQGIFVGHPASKHLYPSRGEVRQQLGVDDSTEIIAILPGKQADGTTQSFTCTRTIHRTGKTGKIAYLWWQSIIKKPMHWYANSCLAW